MLNFFVAINFIKLIKKGRSKSMNNQYQLTKALEFDIGDLLVLGRVMQKYFSVGIILLSVRCLGSGTCLKNLP